MSRLLSKTTVKGLRKKRAMRRRRQEIITSFKMTRAMNKDVQFLAKKMDRTQSWILREAVQSWLTFHMARQQVEVSDEDRTVYHDD
jgi:hypothetical protein